MKKNGKAILLGRELIPVRNAYFVWIVVIENDDDSCIQFNTEAKAIAFVEKHNSLN